MFCRRVFADSLESSSAPAERAALAQAFERIQAYLDSDVQPSANGLAIFASAGADGLFEAVQLAAPIDQHECFVGDVPHIFPLARVIDQNPRYAAVLLDSNQARIIVFGLGAPRVFSTSSWPATKRSWPGSARSCRRSWPRRSLTFFASTAGQYTSAGRLTPDDLGRERQKQVDARTAPPAPAPKRRVQSPRAAPARGRVRARGER